MPLLSSPDNLLSPDLNQAGNSVLVHPVDLETVITREPLPHLVSRCLPEDTTTTTTTTTVVVLNQLVQLILPERAVTRVERVARDMLPELVTLVLDQLEVLRFLVMKDVNKAVPVVLSCQVVK